MKSPSIKITKIANVKINLRQSWAIFEEGGEVRKSLVAVVFVAVVVVVVAVVVVSAINIVVLIALCSISHLIIFRIGSIVNK